MTRARRELVSLDDTPYYHCVSRCVRRAFLCGMDHSSGNCFEHRRGWILRRLKTLARVFAIDIAAYAIMSNHYHLVLRINQTQAESWSRDEVIERWTRLFSGHRLTKRYSSSGATLTEAELGVVNEIVSTWRERLIDVSWFMRCLNEHIARMANAEDQCTGRFWEGRFKSQALLDETALLACMVYVDLNPIRANMTDRLENSDFTSIQERLGIIPDHFPEQAVKEPQEAGKQAELMAFAGNLTNSTPGNTLPYNFADYLDLVDWTGRALGDNKRGSISNDVPTILQHLNIDSQQWLKGAGSLEKHFYTAIGPVAKLKELCQKLEKRWLHGFSACRAFYHQASPT